MKRYLLFMGMHYYPFGGWKDFKDSFDTIEEAQQHFKDANLDSIAWYQIVDTSTWEIVE